MQSQWSSQQGGSHGRGYRDDQVSMEGFKTYWTAFLNNCSTFKKYRAGWYVNFRLLFPLRLLIDLNAGSSIPSMIPRNLCVFSLLLAARADEL